MGEGQRQAIVVRTGGFVFWYVRGVLLIVVTMVSLLLSSFAWAVTVALVLTVALLAISFLPSVSVQANGDVVVRNTFRTTRLARREILEPIRGAELPFGWLTPFGPGAETAQVDKLRVHRDDGTGRVIPMWATLQWTRQGAFPSERRKRLEALRAALSAHPSAGRSPGRIAASGLVIACAVLSAGCSSDDQRPAADPSGASSSNPGVTTSTMRNVAVSLPRRQVIDLPTDLAGAEGIAIDPVTRSLFAGEWGRGRILRGSIPTSSQAEQIPVTFETFVDTGPDGPLDVVGLAVDPDRRRLVAAGGDDPHVYVYDIDSATRIAKVPLAIEPGSYVNDVGIGPAGEIFATLSGGTAALFQVFVEDGASRSEVFVDYSAGSPIPLDTPGRLLNGIVVEADVILTVHTATGQLFRIDRASREITEVDTGTDRVGRDGLALIDDTLLAVDIQAFSGLAYERITTTRLDADRRRGEVTGEILDEGLRSPTTIALLDGRLFVVNAKFGLSERPFTVFSLPLA